ncbi:LysR substrate-binding domain-containing protein [Rothia sp. ZJ1223]|uniref:LysR substrate-binding domain-containing protein n=1 Tax=Rothia sp. ZJ1223 TaxID=2811098 RepID=UPI00195B7100|nr:LysR substrate-binding domain-containing protein [Rothia sp. ZJ1223]MBM7051156.1 transcriptional regulator [Rothia sp. ZJ1223]
MTEIPVEDVTAAERLPLVAEEHAPLLADHDVFERLHSFDAHAYPMRVGFVPGVMPGKWFGRWHDRYGQVRPLAEIPLAEKAGLAALDGFARMVLIRPEHEPVSADKDRYHRIELYREQQVVVMPQDHLLSILDEVPVAELAEEFLLQEPETVPEWAAAFEPYRASNPQKLPQMRHTKDAVELVAAGLGLLIVPLSIARLYHRKDLTHRPVPDIKTSAVALVWKREFREDIDEAMVQDFVGICRGRTAASDRGTDSKQQALEKKRKEKEEAQRKRRAANARREEQDRKARNARKNGNARQHSAQKAKVTGKPGGKKRR